MDNYYFTSAYNLLIANLVNERVTEFVELPSLPAPERETPVENLDSPVTQTTQPTPVVRSVQQSSANTPPAPSMRTVSDVANSGLSSGGSY